MRYVVKGVQPLAFKPQDFRGALIFWAETRLTMVALVEGDNTANFSIPDLTRNCGEVDVTQAFFLILAIRQAYSGVWVVEY